MEDDENTPADDLDEHTDDEEGGNDADDAKKPKDGDDAGDNDDAGGSDDEDEGDDPDEAPIERKLAASRKSEKKALRKAERLQRELDKLKGDKKGKAGDGDPDVQEELAELRRERRERRTADQFRDAAIEAGIHPKRLRAAQALADLDLDDDGNIVNIEDAIEELVEDHDYLIADSGSSGPSKPRRKKPKEGGSNAGKGSGKHDNGQKQLTAEQLEMAKRFGRKPEDYAKYVD